MVTTSHHVRPPKPALHTPSTTTATPASPWPTVAATSSSARRSHAASHVRSTHASSGTRTSTPVGIYACLAELGVELTHEATSQASTGACFFFVLTALRVLLGLAGLTAQPNGHFTVTTLELLDARKVGKLALRPVRWLAGRLQSGPLACLHLSKLPGPGCGGQIYWIADMVQKLLILKWTIVVDDIKHTSKDDKVDLPHPLVPHKSIVTDSFLSLILIRTVGKEKKGNVTKKETLSITFRLLWNGCDKLLRVKYIDSVTTNIFDLNKEC